MREAFRVILVLFLVTCSLVSMIHSFGEYGEQRHFEVLAAFMLMILAQQTKDGE